MMTTSAPPMYGEPDTDLYAADMVKRVLLGIQDFRTALAARVKAGTATGEHTVLQMRGKPVGVYVPIDWYRRAAEAVDEPTEF
jgi:hypothetical protein